MAFIPIKSMSKAVPCNLSKAFKILHYVNYRMNICILLLSKKFSKSPTNCLCRSTLVANQKTRKVADTLWSIGTKISGSGKNTVNIDVDGVYFSSDETIQYLSTVICTR